MEYTTLSISLWDTPACCSAFLDASRLRARKDLSAYLDRHGMVPIPTIATFLISLTPLAGLNYSSRGLSPRDWPPGTHTGEGREPKSPGCSSCPRLRVPFSHPRANSKSLTLLCATKEHTNRLDKAKAAAGADRPVAGPRPQWFQ